MLNKVEEGTCRHQAHQETLSSVALRCVPRVEKQTNSLATTKYRSTNQKLAFKAKGVRGDKDTMHEQEDVSMGAGAE